MNSINPANPSGPAIVANPARKRLVAGLVFAGTLFAAACAPKDARAPRVAALPGQTLSARDFAPTDLEFKETQLFLWKPGFTDGDVASVLEHVTQLDGIKADIYELSGKWVESKEKFAAIEIDANELLGEEAGLPEKRATLAEYLKPVEDMLRLPVDRVDAANEKEFERALKKYLRVYNQIEEIEGKLRKVSESGLDREYQVGKDLAQARQKSSDLLVPINDTVWLYNSSPIRFQFSFGSGGSGEGGPTSLQVRISNWDLGKINDPAAAEDGAATEFSTENHSIGRVSYATWGGVFSFEVYTPKATFWFKIARANYAARDGRIYYKGDIVRCAVTGGYGRPVVLRKRDFVRCGIAEGSEYVPDGKLGKVDERRGVANLIDRNDNRD